MKRPSSTQFQKAVLAISTRDTGELNKSWASVSPTTIPSQPSSPFRPISPQPPSMYEIAKEALLKRNATQVNTLYKYPKPAMRKSRKNRKANRKTRKNRR